MTSEIPAICATKEEPTEPREPTRYPFSTELCTSFWAIMYSTANPCLMMEVSSLSRRLATISGTGSP